MMEKQQLLDQQQLEHTATTQQQNTRKVCTYARCTGTSSAAPCLTFANTRVLLQAVPARNSVMAVPH
jgi:hypothetical protein